LKNKDSLKNDKTKNENCRECGMPRYNHAKNCEYKELADLALDMWYYIWEIEGRKHDAGRCNSFRDKLHKFVS